MAYESYEETEERNTSAKGQQDAFENDSMASYTPEQREMIRKGKRILAHVAVRAHMRRHASASTRPESETDDGDE